MAYVFQTTFGAALAERLAPWMNDDLALYCDAIGAMFEETYALVYDQGVDDDPDYVPGYGALFDVDLCPPNALGFLAQIVGVTLPQGVDDQHARALIRAASGKGRGTPASIRAAIESALSTVWAPNTTYATGVFVTQEIPNDNGIGTRRGFYIVTAPFTSGASFSTANLAEIDPTTQYQLLERTDTAGHEDAYWITIIAQSSQLTPAGNTGQMVAAINNVKPAGIRLNIVLSNTPLLMQYTRLLSAITVSIGTATLADVT